MSAYVTAICLIVALLAWCGAMWSYVRVARQLRAAGYSIWTFNPIARWNAWKGDNIVLFLSCSAIFVAAIATAILVT